MTPSGGLYSYSHNRLLSSVQGGGCGHANTDIVHIRLAGLCYLKV